MCYYETMNDKMVMMMPIGRGNAERMSDHKDASMYRDCECPEPLTYTRHQAATRAGFSVSHLDRLVKSGELTPIRFGRKVLFDRKAFDEWILRRRAVTTEGAYQ
jgi:excisionase family DNA binding protein